MGDLCGLSGYLCGLSTLAIFVDLLFFVELYSLWTVWIQKVLCRCTCTKFYQSSSITVSDNLSKMKLASIAHLRAAVEHGYAADLRLLYTLLFGAEVRLNRKDILNFEGFRFNSVQAAEKLESVVTQFSLNELSTMATLLSLEHAGDAKAVAFRLLSALDDVSALAPQTTQEQSTDDNDNLEFSSVCGNQDADDDVDRAAAFFADISIRQNTETNIPGPHSRNFVNNACGVAPAMNACSNFKFEDFADLVPPFAGSDTYPIEEFIQTFEDSADILGIGATQRFLFCRRSLKGNALLFVQAQRGVSNYLQLRQILLSEFGAQVSSRAVHEQLTKMCASQNDSFLHFYYKVNKIASTINVDQASIIQYVIAGLPGTELNKLFLHEAHTLQQLKQKIVTYERVYKQQASYTPRRHVPTRSDNLQRKFPVPVSNSTDRLSGPSSSYRDRKCYACGQVGHFIRDCTSRGNRFEGHQSNEPPLTSPNDRSTYMATNQQSPALSSSESRAVAQLVEEQQLTATNTPPPQRGEFLLQVELDDSAPRFPSKSVYDAVLDSGSPVSMIKLRCVNENLIEPNVTNESFYGINQSVVHIIGKFSAKLTVQGLYLDANFYVVSNDTMLCNVLLGRDFIATNNLMVTLQDSNVSLSEADKHNVIPPATHGDILYIESNIFDDPEPNLNISDDIDLSLQAQLRQDFQRNYVEPPRPDEPEVKYEMRIHLTSDTKKPFHFSPRRLSYFEKQEVDRITDDLLSKGIITHSDSEYSSPIVMVTKKNCKQLRLCVDYRALNKLTEKDCFPVGILDDEIDKLKNKSVFTRLDLKDAFYNVSLHKDSIKYTSFTTHRGQFAFLKAAFGLKNSPANFCRFINVVFQDLLRDNKICIYIDDILIATQSVQENLDVLNSIFKKLVLNKLELNLEKCTFFQSEIKFVGYIVNSEGIHPCDEHLQAVSGFPLPRSFKDVQSFIGLTSYFRRFIMNYAIIARPLTDLLRKNVEFLFGNEQLQAFETLKAKLLEKPVLAIFDPHATETQLHCDASSHGFGSILLQKQKDDKLHPVFYFSKKTTPTESKYLSYELEMLCIIYSVRRFRTYLQGLDFTIFTDCESVKLAITKREINTKILHWCLELQSFSYSIEHRPNQYMQHVDCLSRNSILIIEETSFDRVLSIKQEQDPNIVAIREALEHSESKSFELRNGLVYRKHAANLLFYVPENMEQSILRTYHDQVGHVGENKTHELILRSYWFPHLKPKIKEYISNCLKCITYSSPAGKPEGMLMPIPKGDAPFHTIHIDHFGPLETTNQRNKYIFVIIDGFTKFVKLYACASTKTDPTIKHLTDYFRYYSKPIRVVSDRASCFTSEYFTSFLQDQNIVHVLISTGVPRANGQVEVVNKSIRAMCAKLSEATNKWDSTLVQVEFAINNTVNQSSKFSPSQLLFGQHQRGHITDNLRSYLAHSETNDLDLHQIRLQAAANIQSTQDSAKARYDQSHKPSQTYQIGDYVMISNVDVTPGYNKKLLPKYKGPYVIKTVLPNERYVVADIEGFQVTQIPYEGVLAPCRMKRWTQ